MIIANFFGGVGIVIICMVPSDEFDFDRYDEPGNKISFWTSIGTGIFFLIGLIGTIG